MGLNLQESFSFMEEKRGLSKLTPPFDPKELFHLAAQGIYLGTSSWKYRAWEGMIYRGGYSNESQFQRSSLSEYTSYFPAVGVDFTYFTWPLREMMMFLLESVPENFRLCPKVTKRITLSTFPDLPAYGKWAGKKNPDFLNCDLFEKLFCEPISVLDGRLGVVIFEFSGLEEEDLPLLKDFFQRASGRFPFAVEIRNPDLVCASFYKLLKELGVSPALSQWTQMPSIEQQWLVLDAAGGVADGMPLVGLGLLSRGRSHEDALRCFQPYDQIKAADFSARQGLAALGNCAIIQGRKAYILVNNRLEGSAPHTVGKVAELIMAGRAGFQ